MHTVFDFSHIGLAFDHKLKDIKELIERIKTGEYEILKGETIA
jgi:hypothetical protein